MSQQGERTEKATPKKRKDAREKGQIRKSQELNTAFTLILLFGVLSILASIMSGGMTDVMRVFLSGGYLGKETLDKGALDTAFYDAVLMGAKVVLPIMGAALVGGVLINYLQVGFLFTTKAMKPQFSRINPLKGFKRLFSMQGVVEMLKAILKIVVIGAVVYNELSKDFEDIAFFMTLSLPQAVVSLFRMTTNIGFKAGLAFAFIAAADFVYQYIKYEKDLRMTKQEVKDEYKLMEGDPQVKGRIRQKQRQMGMMRMMQAVPDADVIITNPTHYAIAIKYDDKIDKAPVIVAKGKDYVAQRIREKAAQCGIEIVENKPVAQALYAFCNIGDEVPSDLYQAVAEVLAYVYKLKNPRYAGGY